MPIFQQAPSAASSTTTESAARPLSERTVFLLFPLAALLALTSFGGLSASYDLAVLWKEGAHSIELYHAELGVSTMLVIPIIWHAVGSPLLCWRLGDRASAASWGLIVIGAFVYAREPLASWLPKATSSTYNALAILFGATQLVTLFRGALGRSIFNVASVLVLFLSAARSGFIPWAFEMILPNPPPAFFDYDAASLFVSGFLGACHLVYFAFTTERRAA